MKKCFAIRASEYAAMRIKNLENHQHFGAVFISTTDHGVVDKIPYSDS
jgi:hypothetical protein